MNILKKVLLSFVVCGMIFSAVSTQDVKADEPISELKKKMTKRGASSGELKPTSSSICYNVSKTTYVMIATNDASYCQKLRVKKQMDQVLY